jgi:hypothetical protein
VQASADANTALISAEGADRIAGDAATLATAKAHADAGIAAEATARADTDTVNLLAAKQHADSEIGKAEARAATYTDTKVDALASGVSWKAAARALASSNVPISPAANGALAVDGVACAVGDRVLLAGQTDAKQNGLYTVTGAGSASAQYSLARSSDADSSAKMQSAAVFITEGAAYAEQAWVLTTDDAVLGTSDIGWTVFGSPGHYTGSGAVVVGADKQISIAAGGVSTGMLADDAVSSDKMADDAVGAAAIQAGAVGSGAIAADAVTDAKCDFTHVEAAQATFSGEVAGLSFLATSDERRKQDIEDLKADECEAMVVGFRTCRYRFKAEPDRVRTGTIAQSLAAAGGALAGYVHADPSGDMSVNYTDYTSVLSCALKSALARIDALEKA